MDLRILAATTKMKKKKEKKKRGSFVQWHSCRQYEDGYTLESSFNELEAGDEVSKNSLGLTVKSSKGSRKA